MHTRYQSLHLSIVGAPPRAVAYNNAKVQSNKISVLGLLLLSRVPGSECESLSYESESESTKTQDHESECEPESECHESEYESEYESESAKTEDHESEFEKFENLTGK